MPEGLVLFGIKNIIDVLIQWPDIIRIILIDLYVHPDKVFGKLWRCDLCQLHGANVGKKEDTKSLHQKSAIHNVLNMFYALTRKAL